MSVLNRSQRASAKSRAHARTAAPVGGVADVPVELASQDYDLPLVERPASRPIVTAAELHDALACDETPTVTLPRVVLGREDKPQPAHAEGLAPVTIQRVPVPSNPFLNAGPSRVPPFVPVAKALPGRLTDVELRMLGRQLPAGAPPAPSLPPGRHARQSVSWQQRLDDLAGYWERVQALFESGPSRYVREKSAFDLAQMIGWSEHLRQQLRRPYAHDPHTNPLPRRVPGAAKARIDAGEVAVAR